MDRDWLDRAMDYLAPTRRALVAAYDEERDRLVVAVMARAGVGRDDAEDVLHDVVLNILDGEGDLPSVEDCFRYLREAAINQAHNQRRNLSRAQQRAERAAALAEAGRPVADPAEFVAAASVWETAMAFVDALPEPERAAFWLRYWDDLSYAAIAGRLGVTTDKVNNLLRSARKHLAAMEAESKAHDPTYVIVLAALRRYHARAIRYAARLADAPPVNAVSATVAAAMLAVATVVPSPVTRPPVSGPTISAAPIPHFTLRGGASTGPGPQHVRPVVGAGRTAADPAHAPRTPRQPPPLLALPGLPCVRGACVTGIPSRGDTLTITVVPGQPIHVATEHTPACDYIPTTPVTTCTRQEP